MIFAMMCQSPKCRGEHRTNGAPHIQKLETIVSLFLIDVYEIAFEASVRNGSVSVTDRQSAVKPEEARGDATPKTKTRHAETKSRVLPRQPR
jgi:hypothetical protein